MLSATAERIGGRMLLTQGVKLMVEREQARREQEGCKNPNCLRPYEDRVRFVNVGDNRRCSACYTCLQRKNERRPRKL
jgi:hypothetical protein